MSGSRSGEPNLRCLVEAADALKSDYIADGSADPWAGSPFAWIKTLPSRQIGKIGEQLVERWCSSNGLTVHRSGDSEADRVISGRRIEIKFSSLWKNGSYTFQQIRDQNYHSVVCLGISPFAAHCWVIGKPALQQHVIGHLPQHRGHHGSDTFWVSVDPTRPHDWLRTCGGGLDDAMRILRGWSRS